MAGQRQEDEEERGMEYQPYRPQIFDEGEPGPADRPDQRPSAEFLPQHTVQPGAQSTFQEGPHADRGPEPDFASIKFQRENTLLTNAESYAASIREEAQLYVRQLRGEVDALNRQAEQRYQEAEQAREQAQAEAERRLADANAGVEEVREQARREGFEAGREEGIKQRYEEAAPHLERLEAILQEISQFRRRVAFYTEKDGVRLALLIAKKVLQAELKINKQAVAKLLASTLARLEGKGTFRVWLNPDDYQFVAAARPSLERYLDEEQALTLRAKPDLRPGNVLIETDREVIDLTFESQFYHLEQQLSQTLAERESMLQRGQGLPPQGTPPAAASGKASTRPAAAQGAQRPAARAAARRPQARPARPAQLDRTGAAGTGEDAAKPAQPAKPVKPAVPETPLT
jgi:flagellar assembly protein FliH